MSDDKSFATVAIGTENERKVEIEHFLQSKKNGSTFQVAKLKGSEGYILQIENDKTTGKQPCVNMWLSEESFVAIYNLSHMFSHLLDLAPGNPLDYMGDIGISESFKHIIEKL